MEKHSGQWSACNESKNSSDDANVGRFYTSVPHYSEEEAQALAKKLDNDETFKEALKILIAWLESGECNERNSAGFYSLIQLCWNRVEKLKAEEKEIHKEIKSLKKNVLIRRSCIHSKVIEIEKIFNTMEKRNLWICFTEDHLEKIREMKADLLNLQQIILKDCMNSELLKESDVENIDAEKTESDVHKMQAKLGSLTFELNTVKQETEKMQAKRKEYENEILELRSKLEKSRLCQNMKDLKLDRKQKAPVCGESASQCNLDLNEMHIVSLVSVFLFDHPEGADSNDIYSHLKKSIPFTNATGVEKILKKYPKIFQECQPVFPFEKKVWTCVSISPETRRELLNK